MEIPVQNDVRNDRRGGQNAGLKPGATFCVRCVTVLALVVLAGAVGWVPAPGARDDAPAAYRAGVVLMAFRSGTSQAQEGAIVASIGAKEIKRIGVGVHVLSVGRGRVLGAIQSLKAHREVRYAEPDYLETLASSGLPNDTYVGIEWAIQNTGQVVNGVSGAAGADERTLPAWSVTTGTNSVVVAVLDSGVQYSHPDLLTNMWNNPGGIGGCAAGTHGYDVLSASCDPMDQELYYGGHGTHVAGILGAMSNNAAGIAGVNWTTSVMAVRWVKDSPIPANTSDLITAMDWVVHAKQAGVNVRIVNDSATWPSTAFSQALSDEIDLLGSNDILFVAAAGNTAQNNDTVARYPCSYNRLNMICVAASDQNDNLWSSSNYGTTSVQLAAPGVNIYSTLRQSNYGYVSGTSMAAPQVAGTAALILSLGYQPVSNLRAMILSSVDPLPSLASYVATGGRLNVCKAVPGCSTGTTGTPASSSLPVVTGIPQQGSILGASTGRWSGMPTMYAYQWYRCSSGGANCAPIAGATSPNYAVLASADIGGTLSVAVTASNSSGSSSPQSNASGVVAPAASPFVINSTILDGNTINGTLQWQATPAHSVNFVQFYIDGVLNQTDSSSPYIYNQGTTGLLDTTTLSNGTHVLGIEALSADNRTYGFYGATVTVANPPANTALPAISGTPIESQTLSTSNGSWTSNPTGYIYQWDRCDVNGLNCSVIQGATGSSYALASTDVNFTIRSSVTATNSAGSSTAVSAQTAIVQPGPPSVSTNSLPGATQNGAYSAMLTATGGITPYTWSIAAGSLPAGLTLASNTGVISGTPTGTGASSFTVQVTDANSRTATNGLNLTVNAPPAITTSSLPAGIQNTAYGATVTVAGGTTPFTWSILSGSLPAGLALSSTGVISGTPTGTGTSSFTLQVTDANSQTATQALSLTINPSGGGGGITLVQSNAIEGSGVASLTVAFPASNTAGNLIVAFVRMSTVSQSVQVSDSAGNTYTDAVVQTQTNDGHQVHIFYAANIAGGANTVTATFSAINSHPWLAIYEYSGLSTTNPLDQTANAQGSGSIPNTGKTATTVSANELVFAGAGMASAYTGAVSAGSDYTLLEQDTATSRAANEAVVTSTGSYGSTFSLTTNTNWSAALATFVAAGARTSPTITTSSLPSGTKNAPYNATLAATGGAAPYNSSIISGSLPAGLTLASSTGVISGTPTGTGTSSFTVQVTDSNSRTATKGLNVTVNPTVRRSGIALVQSTALEVSGVGSMSLAFPSGNTAGNLIIAFVRMSTTSQTVQVTDSAGNAYTDAVAQTQTADNHQVHIFYAKNVAGGANTVTATFSSTNSHPWLAIYEYSGLSTTNPLDQTARAQGSGATPNTGMTATTVSANELVFAATGFMANYTGTARAGSGFTLQQQDTGTSRAASEAVVVTSTGAYAATFSLRFATQWSAVLATFKR